MAARRSSQPDTWGYSSAGRAPALQAGGQRFESASLHAKRALLLGLVLDFPRKFPDGAERPWLGMFFETVNRIWRMDYPPMWLQRWGDGVGWSVREVCEVG